MEEQGNGFNIGMLLHELPYASVGLMFIVPFLYESLGFGERFFSLVLFSGFLLLLSFIDIRCGMIFNRFLVPMVITGILLDCAGFMTEPLNGVMAGFFGGGVLLLIRWCSSGGMGGGDVKLGFVLGIWLGLDNTIVAFFLAFIVGSIAGLILMVIHRQTRLIIPFGPFLSIGGWMAAMYGSQLIRMYEEML